MRTYLTIDLRNRSVAREELHGEAIVRAGRHFIAKTLNERRAFEIDPMSPDNPLIFSAGPFAGTNFSNANRLSVGCRSPLTGGIKEANSGGTFAFALGQCELAGFTLEGACDDWTLIRITKEREVSFEDGREFLGLGNNEVASRLFERYGRKISYAICGPVGEYLGLVAGIAFADTDGRPSRLAARGGVGAVMGVKRVKVVVIDQHKMPRRRRSTRSRSSAPRPSATSPTTSAACRCATSPRDSSRPTRPRSSSAARTSASATSRAAARPPTRACRGA